MTIALYYLFKMTSLSRVFTENFRSFPTPITSDSPKEVALCPVLGDPLGWIQYDLVISPVSGSIQSFVACENTRPYLAPTPLGTGAN